MDTKPAAPEPAASEPEPSSVTKLSDARRGRARGPKRKMPTVESLPAEQSVKRSAEQGAAGKLVVQVFESWAVERGVVSLGSGQVVGKVDLKADDKVEKVDVKSVGTVENVDVNSVDKIEKVDVEPVGKVEKVDTKPFDKVEKVDKADTKLVDKVDHADTKPADNAEKMVIKPVEKADAKPDDKVEKVENVDIKPVAKVDKVDKADTKPLDNVEKVDTKFLDKVEKATVDHIEKNERDGKKDPEPVHKQNDLDDKIDPNPVEKKEKDKEIDARSTEKIGKDDKVDTEPVIENIHDKPVENIDSHLLNKLDTIPVNHTQVDKQDTPTYLDIPAHSHYAESSEEDSDGFVDATEGHDSDLLASPLAEHPTAAPLHLDAVVAHAPVNQTLTDRFDLLASEAKSLEAEFSDPIQPMTTKNDSPKLKTDTAPGPRSFASINTADSPDSSSTTVPVHGNATEERNDTPAAN